MGFYVLQDADFIIIVRRGLTEGAPLMTSTRAPEYVTRAYSGRACNEAE